MRLNKLDQVLWPERGTERVIDPGELVGPQIGKVTDVTIFGVKLTIDTYDHGVWKFGPYPWHTYGLTAPDTGDTVAGGTNHHHTNTIGQPAVGNHCLVIFTGTGTDKGVVVAWWA